MLEQLIWEQTKKNVFVSIKYENKDIKFKLDDRILMNLIGNSPKVYFFTINIGEDKLEFLADFTNLKPIVKSSGKLKFKVKSASSNIISEVSTFGNYVIARGESFYDRFLGVKGWQAQEYLFNLIPLELKDSVVKIEEKKQPTTILQETKQTEIVPEIVKKTTQIKETIPQKTEKSKFQECPQCGNLITSDFDYCPHCFKSTIQPEKGIDFAI